MDDDVSIDQMFMGLVALKLTKSPEGLKVLQVLGKEFIKGIFDTMHALGQASAANYVTAWANPYLVALILRRFKFIDNLGAAEFKMGLSVITGATVIEGFIDEIARIFPFSSPDPSEFPSSIVYSGRTEGGQITEEITAKGISPKDIEQLRKLLGQKQP